MIEDILVSYTSRENCLPSYEKYFMRPGEGV